MIIIADSRVSGKTTEAIKLASSTRSTLLVPDGQERYAEQLSKEMKFPVKIITSRDFKRYYVDGCCYERIVIDELDTVLEQLFGAEVIMATTTGFKIEGFFNPNLKIDGKFLSPLALLNKKESEGIKCQEK